MVFSKLRVVCGKYVLSFHLFGVNTYCARACYIAIPLYICGFVTLGAAFQMHLSVGAVVMGWGIAQLAIMITTVAVCKCTAAFSCSCRLIIIQMLTPMTASRNTE